jgi:glycosyltransferase involved in cell wall biosynthesis
MKQKVLFVLPSLHGGGAQRVMVTLLKHLNRQKFDIYLALVAKNGAYLSEVPTDVIVYDLGAGRVRHAFKPLLQLIHKLKPDTVFSTLGHMNLALILLKAFMPSKTRLIVREACIVSEFIRDSKYNKVWTLLYKYLYKRSDKIICQSKYMMNDLIENFNIPKKKILQIYNPVDIIGLNKRASSGDNPFGQDSNYINIIAIGRLSQEKGYDRLINSVPQLLKLKPNSKVWILGEGPLEEQLIKLRDSLGLYDHVKFVGFQENPYLWLKHADLFVLSSYYEGLPNVLLEAIACGCPVITVDHPGGTREIMMLTQQNDKCVKKLEWLPNYYIKNEKAFELLHENFSLDVIVEKYEEILLA